MLQQRLGGERRREYASSPRSRARSMHLAGMVEHGSQQKGGAAIEQRPMNYAVARSLR